VWRAQISACFKEEMRELTSIGCRGTLALALTRAGGKKQLVA
jgi:hypothetical protein